MWITARENKDNGANNLREYNKDVIEKETSALDVR